MENPAVLKTAHGKVLWVNEKMDALRKIECLCLNCDNMKPGQPDHCKIAKHIFETVCLPHGAAMAITKCPIYKPKS